MKDYYNNVDSREERCPNCGNIVEAGSVFCAYCGKKINYPVTQPQNPENGTYADAGDAAGSYRQVNGGYGYQQNGYQAGRTNSYEDAKTRVAKGAGQIIGVIFMIILAVMLITRITDLILTMGTINRVVSVFDYNGDLKEMMQAVSGLAIGLGLLGMIPFILEVIGTCVAVIGGLSHNIKTTGFTLINAGLVLSLIGAVLKSISGLMTVIGVGAMINSEVTRYGGDSIVPYIIALVLCIVAYLVLVIFYYRGLMRPASTAKRILTTGSGEIKLSLFSMIILGLNALAKLISMIGSGSFNLNKFVDQFADILGPMDMESRMIINAISGVLQKLSVQQMVRNGVELLVLVLAIVVMVMFKNSVRSASVAG